MELDFTATYKVAGTPAVAWRIISFDTEEYEYDPGIDGEEGMPYMDVREDESRVRCHMVGDDSVWTFDVEDLTVLNEDEYCGGCGQIGCGWH